MSTSGNRDSVRLDDYRTALKSAVSSESKAYGFTLVVWGAASLVMSRHGLAGLSGTVAYIGGLLAGMSIAVLVALGGPFKTWTSMSLRRYAIGAIHLGSVAAGMGAGYAAALVIRPHWAAYLGAGLAAGLVYQLSLGLEVDATRASEGSGSNGD
jgi:hypothetical protein